MDDYRLTLSDPGGMLVSTQLISTLMARVSSLPHGLAKDSRRIMCLHGCSELSLLFSQYPHILEVRFRRFGCAAIPAMRVIIHVGTTSTNARVTRNALRRSKPVAFVGPT